VSLAPLAEGAPVAVAVEDLVVRFGAVEAVRGASFSVLAGETFGLLGPNGAGKTTTLRVLTTLLSPTSGRAWVAGLDVATQGIAVRGAIGYVPQALSADGTLTTRENLEFYARVGGLRRRERVVRIGEVVEAMNLEGFLERMTSALSGGMLRRLEIATALLTRPRVLFLDEPTVGLDPVARRLVWERLGALRESAGTTLLVTTHLMDEAEDHCERLAIMDRGRVVAEGAPAELRAEWGAGDLDEVFSTVTGREPEEAEGRIRDVRARRRIARRLG
jgi:ABC-2 type transport system ATP-binding protein